MCTNSHPPHFSSLHCGCQPPLLPRSAAEIPWPIRWARHCCYYRYPVSDIIGRPLLCWPLLCMRCRQIHQSRCFRSVKRDNVDVLTPIIPDVFLLCHYQRRPRRTAYLLPSLSSAALIIPHLFFFSLVLYPCYISSAAVSVALFIHRHFRCHPFPPSLSSHFSDSAVILNLIRPCIFQLLSSPSPHSHHIALHFPITFTDVVVLSIFRVSDASVSGIRVYLMPTSLSNLPSHLTLSLSPAYPP